MSRPLRNLKQGFITIRPSPGFFEPGRGFDGLVRPETLPKPDRQESPEGRKPPGATGAEPQDTADA